MSEIPSEYLCPVSWEIMKNPYICSDGTTYDKSSICKLYKKISPLTRKPIKCIIPNLVLKQIIQKYLEANNMLQDISTDTDANTDANNTFTELIDSDSDWSDDETETEPDYTSIINDLKENIECLNKQIKNQKKKIKNMYIRLNFKN